jgi:feruloyl-CoA synthase
VQPTLYFNVPRGYEMMLPALEADDDAGAPLLRPAAHGVLRRRRHAGQATWQRLEAVAARVRSAEPLWMTTSWGSTETAPAITFATGNSTAPGSSACRMPGVKLKFVPNGGKLEMRIRGDNIFPGYRDNPAGHAAAFDEEGYYCIGDAGHLLPTKPARCKAWSSTAAWPRTSSSPAAPGSAWARCA